MTKRTAEATLSPRSGIAERYRLLIDIGRTLTETLGTDDLYREICRGASRVLETAGFYISLYDSSRDLATIVFYADRGQDRRVEITYRGSESEVIRTGKAALIQDRGDMSSVMLVGEEESDVTRSAITAPMRHKGEVIGTISTQSYRPSAYTEDDLELLQAVADMAAVALDNARYVAELERQRHESEQIEAIGRTVASSLDRQEVLSKVVDAMLGLLHADAASVWLLEGQRQARMAAAGGERALPDDFRWDFEGVVFERVIRQAQPLRLDDFSASPDFPSVVMVGVPGGSGIIVPLVLKGEVVGALACRSRHTGFFGDHDTRIMQRLADQAAVALENARLHASLQATSLTDPLTGLPNRRHLSMYLEREVAAARRGRQGPVLCLHDLDYLKRYNDSSGHLAGDEALRAFGRILMDENRAMNLVARYGGDEFISVLSESSLEGALIYIGRVDARIAGDALLGPANITASTGLAVFNRETMMTADDLIQAADAELYKKKARRGL